MHPVLNDNLFLFWKLIALMCDIHAWHVVRLCRIQQKFGETATLTTGQGRVFLLHQIMQQQLQWIYLDLSPMRRWHRSEQTTGCSALPGEWGLEMAKVLPRATSWSLPHTLGKRTIHSTPPPRLLYRSRLAMTSHRPPLLGAGLHCPSLIIRCHWYTLCTFVTPCARASDLCWLK